MTASAASSFGEELRHARQVREVSLESIAAATKISTRYLEALEKGDFARLPAPVFTRGFIRAYAVCLGLNPDEMVNAYIAETGELTPTSIPLERRRRQKSRRPSAAALVISALILLLVTLIVVGIWRQAGRRQTVRAVPRVAVTPVVPVHPGIVRAPHPVSTTAPPAAVPARGMALDLSFQADCWVEIFADDRLVYSGLLTRGDERHFDALGSFRLTLGNAAAATLVINGHKLPPLGKSGQVIRDLRIDPSSLPRLLSPGS